MGKRCAGSKAESLVLCVFAAKTRAQRLRMLVASFLHHLARLCPYLEHQVAQLFLCFARASVV
jgi:hypothetical protein